MFDRGNIIAEFDGSGTLTSRNIRGYTLLAQKDDKGRLSYYLHDAHGDIMGLIDASGKVLNSYQYDAFGNTMISAETVANRFRYAGEQFDPITGHYYLRARYYDPTVGRFTQEDTYRGDGLNLYAYVGNNPVNFIDPSGHAHVRDDGASGGKCGGTGNTDTVQINIYSGSRFSNFYGHTDISIEDKVYSFAAYDIPSNSKYNATGNGVLMVVDKDDYLEKNALDRFIMSYTLNLTKEETGKMKEFYTNIIENSEVTFDYDIYKDDIYYVVDKEGDYGEYNVLAKYNDTEKQDRQNSENKLEY